MVGKRYFSEDDLETGVTPSQLRRMGKVRQRAYIEYWFRRNFEYPANETPRPEGKYEYVWGGPYDAHDELNNEFGEIVPDERLQAIGDNMVSDGIYDWAPDRDHPDHERAAADYTEEHETLLDGGPASEPDFASIIRDLETGLQLSYGSADERQQRQVLSSWIALLTAEAGRLRPIHGGMGHNNPPADEDEAAVPPAVLDQLDEASNAIEAELAKSEPDALVVARSASRLQAIGHWLAGKGDKIADEFAKSFGKTLGVSAAVVITGGTLLPLVLNVVHAAYHWFGMVMVPF